MEPAALALREDFPDAPHTYLVSAGSPKSLCLFEAPYAERQLHWTAAAYLRQLHSWLSRTAYGELHEQDQPLEPFLGGAPPAVVLPSALFRVDALPEPQRLSVHAVPRGAQGHYTLIARPVDDADDSVSAGRPCTALVVEAEPQIHRGLRSQPERLSDLQKLLSEMGVDLLGALRDNLRDWVFEERGEDEALVLVVMRIPRRRTDGCPPEDVEVWAFALSESVQKVGESFGFFDSIDGVRGAIVGAADIETGAEDLPLLVFNPVPDLTRQRARALSGHDDTPEVRILAIGAGALGSQTILHLARSGFGTWTVVDRDVLLPHNLVRHALLRMAVGCGKASAVAYLGNGLVEDNGVVDSLSENVLTEPFPDSLLAEFDLADVTVDFTASVPAARRLALDAPGTSRRISLFLNPNGTDLVLMAEDQDRTRRLDLIEMQYYRALMQRDELEEHLLRRGEQFRYAHTCRDVTSTLSQDTLAILSGIAARALRETIARPEAQLAIWQTSADHTVSRLSVSLAASQDTICGDWRIWIDEGVLQELHDRREAALPNETGGVLLGHSDLFRKVLYVVDTIPSPPDSEEWPTAYIRGAAGLKEQVDNAARRTGEGIGYLGEWHSHPDGAACTPSGDDREFLVWLTRQMFSDGLPALMGIVCGGGEVVWRLGRGDLGNG